MITRTHIYQKLISDLNGLGLVYDKNLKCLTTENDYPLRIFVSKRNISARKEYSFILTYSFGKSDDPEDFAIEWAHFYRLERVGWQGGEGIYIEGAELLEELAFNDGETWEESDAHRYFSGPFKSWLQFLSDPSRAFRFFVNAESIHWDLYTFHAIPSGMWVWFSWQQALRIAIATSRLDWLRELQLKLEHWLEMSKIASNSTQLEDINRLIERINIAMEQIRAK